MEKVNPGKYKLVSEADTHYELLHPEGGTFKVAKSPLDDKTHDFIKGLPLAHGGKVPHYDEGTPTEPVQEDFSTVPDPASVIDYSKLSTPVPQAETPHDFLSPEADHSLVAAAIKKTLADPKLPLSDAYSQAKAEQSPDAAPTEAKTPVAEAAAPTAQPEAPKAAPQVAQAADKAAGAAPDAAGPTLSDIGKTYQEAIKTQNASRGQVQSTFNDLQKNLALQQVQQEQYVKEMDQKYNAAMADMQQNPIKAHSVWNSPSVGNKILAAIAVTLGGIGSGITGQPNSALAVINKAMDMDLDAQKASAANKTNLLRLGMDKFKDLHSAMLDSMNYKIKASQLYLDQIAQQTQNPLVKMQIQKDTMALQQQYQMNNWELAKRQTSLAAAAGQTTDNPLLLPEGTAVRIPSKTGKVQYIPARDKAAADELSNHLAATQDLRDIVNKMDERMKQQFGDINPDDVNLAPGKYLRKLVGTDYARDAATLAGQFKGQLRSVLAKGKTDPKSVEEAVEAMTPDINSFRVDQAKRHINHTRELLDTLDRNAIQSATPLRVPR